MTDLTSYAASFATPQSGDTLATVRALALARLNSTRKRIASVLLESGNESSGEDLVSFTPGGGTAWRPETGLALLAYRNQQYELAGLQWAAASAGMGGSGNVRIRIDTPQWLYLDGALLPVTGDCTLVADGDSLVIESDCGAHTFRVTGENLWSSTEAGLCSRQALLRRDM